MLTLFFTLLMSALTQSMTAATSAAAETPLRTSCSAPGLEDAWLREKIAKVPWITPENRPALALAIKKYISSGYSHIASSINEALRHFKELSPAEFEERVVVPFNQGEELTPLTEEDVQKHFEQKIAACYPQCSREKQAQHVTFFMKKLRETTKDTSLAWKLERGLQKIESDFEKRQKKIAREVQAKYPDISPAHQEVLARFLTHHSLEIVNVRDASALLEHALLDPHSNAAYRRKTGEELTQTRQQRDDAQQETTILRELLRQAQEAQATAEHRSPADVERESAARERVLQDLVTREAAAVHEKERVATQLAQEQEARTAAEAKAEEYKKALIALEKIATKSIDAISADVATLNKKSWVIAPFNKWKAPTNTVWFPWLFVLSFYGSEFFDVDSWITDCAKNFKLTEIRDFLQKKVIPQTILDNEKIRIATTAVLTALMLKMVHLIMQKRGGGNLITSEGQSPHQLSPNFNTLIHLAGIGFLLWKCNSALLTPAIDDD